MKGGAGRKISVPFFLKIRQNFGKLNFGLLFTLLENVNLFQAWKPKK